MNPTHPAATSTAEATPTPEIRDGDIFRWHYKDGHGRSYSPYWCKSCVAVAKGGYLRDTYWGIASNEETLWSYADAAKTIDLEFLANFDDLIPVDPRMADYFAASDIVDIRHANAARGNFYIRVSAKRSAARMLEIAQYQQEKARSAIENATRDVARMTKVIEQIEAGGDLNDIYL